MTTMLTPSAEDLTRERRELLSTARLSEHELRERSAHYLVTPEEAQILRRLDQIAYLLGESE